MNGLVPTLNQYGYMVETPLPVSQKFIQYAGETKGLVLDIGAAYGAVAIPALKKGATVIANDLDSRHLEILWENTPEYLQKNLRLVEGKFPDAVEFLPSSLKAVHAAGVLHYLPGDGIKKAFKKIFNMLELGGKFFFYTTAPYITLFSKYYPIYLKKKAAGTEWPGLMKNSWFYAPHYKGCIPKRINLLDEDIITHLFISTGFLIEEMEYQSVQNAPQEFQSDGKGFIAVVGKKPNYTKSQI